MAAANERASTTRQRERGQRCAICNSWLGGAAWAQLGTRYCLEHEPNRRIYVSFFLGPHGWRCGFLEPDLKTSAGRNRVFASADKIRELISRTPTHLTLEDQQALDYGINNGRGGIYLEVTGAQYWALKR